MTDPTGGALDGIRVLDLSTQPGHYAGRLLADLGADTIKVEPPGGDAARRVGPFEGEVAGLETSLTWRYFNANKRSVTCNLDLPGGQRLLRELVSDADVLLESYGPGYMESRGVGFDALRAVRPRPRLRLDQRLRAGGAARRLASDGTRGAGGVGRADAVGRPRPARRR